jgi:hypothetical protein
MMVKASAMLVNLLMLGVLIGLFALCAVLVRFAEGVIGREN